MNLDEFLSLPKRKRSPNDKIKDRVRNLRNAINVTGDSTENRPKSCCGKSTYATEREALSSLGHIRNGIKTRRKEPVRAYRCHHGNWHLTSSLKPPWEK